MASNPLSNRTVGRPRRRPFAAHSARAVTLRMENARRAIQELSWRLQGERDVSAYLGAVAPGHFSYFVQNAPVWLATIRRLESALADPQVPAEAPADG